MKTKYVLNLILVKVESEDNFEILEEDTLKEYETYDDAKHIFNRKILEAQR